MEVGRLSELTEFLFLRLRSPFLLTTDSDASRLSREPDLSRKWEAEIRAEVHHNFRVGMLVSPAAIGIGCPGFHFAALGAWDAAFFSLRAFSSLSFLIFSSTLIFSALTTLSRTDLMGSKNLRGRSEEGGEKERVSFALAVFATRERGKREMQEIWALTA